MWGGRLAGAAGSREVGREWRGNLKPQKSRSGRADEGSGLCPRVYGAGLDPMGDRVAEMTVDQSLDYPNHRQILLGKLTG